MREHFDVIIVGAGAVGSTLAISWQRLGYSVAVVEPRLRNAPSNDPRVLALSAHSCAMLDAVGVDWSALSSAMISRVHVSQNGALGRLLLTSDDANLPYLGRSVSYAQLDWALAACLKQSRLTLFEGFYATSVRSLGAYSALEIEQGAHKKILTARLVVASDGGSLIPSLRGIRQHVEVYEDSVILAKLGGVFARDADMAFERFSSGGAFALLPLTDGALLVWTRKTPEAQTLLQYSPDDFLRAFHREAGARFSHLNLMSKPLAVPLTAKWVNRTVSGRVVLLGNAAQTLHPVAAQGLNLGLRDAHTLLTLTQSAQDLGAEAILKAYVSARRPDRFAIMSLTHTLASKFDGTNALGKGVRGAGLAMLDAFPLGRRAFARRLIFGF